MRWLLLLAVACSGSSSAQPTVLSEKTSEPLRRDTPAPAIEWKDNAFATPALPAVARAGELTVLALRENDGGRGYPNLAIEVRDRNDKVLKRVVVMTSNEYETLAPDGKPTQKLEQRIAEANHELAVQHGLHDLVPMHALEMQKAAGTGDQHLAMGDGIDVDWSGDHLHVFQHNSDHPIATVEGKKWLANQHNTHPSVMSCENPAYLSAVYHAPNINVIVVVIAYHGTDTCWEPSDELHAITY